MSIKTTKKGSNYVETKEHIVNVAKYDKAIVIKAIGGRNNYVFVVDDSYKNNLKELMETLSPLDLSVKEFSQILTLLEGINNESRY